MSGIVFAKSNGKPDLPVCTISELPIEDHELAALDAVTYNRIDLLTEEQSNYIKEHFNGPFTLYFEEDN